MANRDDERRAGGPSPTNHGKEIAASLAIERLADAGEKHHRQRGAIVEAFFAFDRRATVHELWNRMRAGGQSVSLSTVQRTLTMLVQHGLARHGQDGRHEASFEPVLDGTDHGRLVCTACRSVTPFVEPRVARLHEVIAKRNGLAIRGHKLEIFGVCERCRTLKDHPASSVGEVVVDYR